MKIAIHQPHYMPWLGYLYKMKNVDIFIYLDDVDYMKNGFVNRNRILINGKEHWLTIPVLTKGKIGQSIKTVKVNWDYNWNMKHYHTLLYNYSKDIKDKEDTLKNFFLQKNGLLIDWCIKSVDLLRQKFKINTKIMLASELKANGNGTEKLVNICKELRADTYFSGPSGKDYMDEKLFDTIKIEYMNWKPQSSLSALHFYLRDNTKII